MTITVLLFDLDDTLVVDEAAVDAALRATCMQAHERYDLDPHALAQSVRRHARQLWRAAPTLTYCRGIGISSAEGLWARFQGDDPHLQSLRAWAPTYRREAWADALEDFGIYDLRLAEQLTESFPAHRRARHWAFPEATTALQELREHYRLALVTNGAPDLQREKLHGAGLVPYFATVIVSGEVGVSKPDSRIFARALADLAVSSSEVAMVGNDLIRDIAGAHAAGLRGIWVNRLHAERANRDIIPDAEVASLIEVLQLDLRTGGGEAA